MKKTVSRDYLSTEAACLLAAASSTMNPKAVAIIKANTPPAVASVLQETFAPLTEVMVALGDMGRACQQGDTEACAQAVVRMVQLVQHSEEQLFVSAASHGVGVEEVIAMMGQVNALLRGAYEQAMVRPAASA